MATKKGADGLSDLDRRCIEAFCGPAKGNQSGAYRIATGTKANESTVKKEAWKIFKRPAVAAEVERRQAAVTEKAVERAALDKAWVMERLEKVVERCLPGEGTGFNAAGANRALELLGKELGMFVDRSEADVNVAFTDMTDERIESRLSELLRKAGVAQPPGGKGAPGRKA